MRKQIAPLLVMGMLLLIPNYSRANIFDKIGDWFVHVFGKHHGQYHEEGENTDRPYAVFDGNNMSKNVDDIRSKITGFTDYYNVIYGELYTEANSSTSYTYNTNAVSNAARIAKNCAFIYIVGLDANGTPLSSAARDNFRNRAITILESSLTKECLGMGAGYFEGSGIWNSYELHQYRSKELIMYLQAYDILKNAYRITGLSVNNSDLETIKDQLHVFTRLLYDFSSFPGSTLDLRNNHALMTAGALGLASIILHDAGANWWNAGDKPERWANAANYVINRDLWTGTARESERSERAGYAEGPYYFTYAFENLMPYFKAMGNLVSKKVTRSYHRHGAGIDGQDVIIPQFENPDYDNLLEWYLDMRQPNGFSPSYDHTPVNSFFPAVAIRGKKEYNVYDNSYFWRTYSNIDLRADILAAMTVGLSGTQTKDASYLNDKSGDIVIRTPYETNLTDAQYLHVNCETGTSATGGRHEKDEYGSFIISAGSDILAMDPPYNGYDAREFTDAPRWTNAVTVDGANPMIDIHETPQIQNNLILLNYGEENHWTVKRGIFWFDLEGVRSYLVVDEIKNLDSRDHTFQFNVNGNGTKTATTLSVDTTDLSNGNVKWFYPCTEYSSDAANHWGLSMHFSKRSTTFTQSNNFYSQALHGNIADPYTSSTSGSHGMLGPILSQTTTDPHGSIGNWGRHGLFYHSVTVPAGEWTRIGATLTPYRCDGSTFVSGGFTIGAPVYTGNHVSTLLDNAGSDHESVIAFVNDGASYDTLNNPFKKTGTHVYGSDGKFSTLTRSTVRNRTFKYCSTSTYFRSASITSGRVLKYDNDTTYISATHTVTGTYKIVGRFKYEGSITVAADSAPVNVTFYLPDLLSSHPMMATIGQSDDTLTSTYVDSTHKLTVTFTAGTTYFTLKPRNECQTSCFFPSSLVNITGLFDFNEGSREVLGNDLDIIRPNGHLKITKGSKVDICSDYTLVNQDSITMVGLWEETQKGLPVYTHYNEDGTPSSTGRKVDDRLKTKKSMIIIRNRAALVLDSASWTHVGANSTILVKKGGTLMIRHGAHLEIGSKDEPGYGEIIAEDGSYVCIEPTTDVHFYRNPEDSIDKNIFFASMKPTIGVHSGVNSAGAGGKFNNPTGRFRNSNCISLCSLKTVVPIPGVNNKYYGWCNFNSPLATFQMQDTVCIGDTVYAYAKGTINDTKYQYQICEFDPLTNNCISGSSVIPPIGYDTTRIGTYRLTDYFSFQPNKTYRVTLLVLNDCSDASVATHIIRAIPKPQPTFTVPTNPCPGVGNISVDGSGSNFTGRHQWTVTMLYDYDYMPEDTNAIIYSKTWSYNGSVSSNFTFPGYHFIGGQKYAISLKLNSYCGSAEYLDTIEIALSADITTDRKVIYKDGIGAGSAHLTGTITGTTSYTWSPSTGLSSTTTLTPTASPNSTTSYILSVSSGSCSDADTVTIQVNNFANGGGDKVICKNSSVQIGTFNPGMPPMYTYSWSPSTGLSNASISRPYASPTTTTTYTLSIMNGPLVVETDKVTVSVDSSVAPYFAVGSTDGHKACFSNYSYPMLPTTAYDWDFGDGSTHSSLANPCHTFPTLDHDVTYTVCLKATTLCGDSTVCDTVVVPADGFPSNYLVQSSGITKRKPGISKPALLNNIPNPFFNATTINYRLPVGNVEAEMVVTNILGKVLGRYKIPSGSSSYYLDCSGFAPGVYLYSLVVDKNVIGTKRMVIQR